MTTSVRAVDPDIPLIIRPSTLGPLVGYGAFATRTISKGDRICEYYGTLMPSPVPSHFMERYKDGGDRYSVTISKKVFLFVHPDEVDTLHKLAKNPACAINDPEPGMHEYISKWVNARLSVNKGKRRAFIVATRQIAEGDEIFINYGPDYWDPVPSPLRVCKGEVTSPEPCHE